MVAHNTCQQVILKYFKFLEKAVLKYLSVDKCVDDRYNIAVSWF